MFEASLSRCTCKLLSSSKYREQRSGEQGRNEGGVISNAQGFQIEKKVAAGNSKVARVLSSYYKSGVVRKDAGEGYPLLHKKMGSSPQKISKMRLP